MRVALSLLVALLLSSGSLAAQGSTFLGVVLDSATGKPLVGASVLAVEDGVDAVTDARGRFELAGVGNGQLTILVRRIGYQLGAVQLELSAPRPVTIDLGSIALSPVVALEPVVVEAELNRRLQDVGFLQRMNTEIGTFITRDDIVKQNPSRTSELLRRVPGMRALTDGSIASTRGVQSVTRAFRLCEVQYFIDGVHAAAPDIDVVIVGSIDGIEIYAGSATIPPLFRGTGNPKCGVVAVWTRDGADRRQVPPLSRDS